MSQHQIDGPPACSFCGDDAVLTGAFGAPLCPAHAEAEVEATRTDGHFVYLDTATLHTQAPASQGAAGFGDEDEAEMHRMVAEAEAQEAEQLDEHIVYDISGETFDLRDVYGARETNGLISAAAYHAQGGLDRTLHIGDRELVAIDRLRLLSDPGFPYWDVSYCHGRTADGERVRVDLGDTMLRRRTRDAKNVPSLAAQLVQICKDNNRYAKGLGILDAVSTLV